MLNQPPNNITMLIQGLVDRSISSWRFRESLLVPVISVAKELNTGNNDEVRKEVYTPTTHLSQ